LEKYRDFVEEQIEDLRLETDADFVLFVEDKEDEIFWETVLKHQKFRLKPKINAFGVSKNDKITTGKDIILKYQPFCSEFPKKVLIAIDSDYDYLLDRGDFNIQNHILQTYTYSIENYFCYAPSLENLCIGGTQSNKQAVFDFEKFLVEYSKIIYPLFIISLLFEQNKTQFSKTTFYSISDFCDDGFIDFKKIKIEDIFSKLSILKEKIEIKVNTLKPNFSNEDIDGMENNIEAKEVGAGFTDNEEKDKYFSNLKNSLDLLKSNYNFTDCNIFTKVKTDISALQQLM